MRGPVEITGPVLVLVGPTAIGKTALSLAIGERFGCEIVSMDSMQVYRYMDIGTAKPDAAERSRVQHHLIDIVDPDEQYNAARFVTDALAAVDDIIRRDRIPLLTGGTGLYLRALTQGLFEAVPISAEVRRRLRQRLAREGREALFAELARIDPITAARIHVNDTQRLLRALEIFHATGQPWSTHLERQRRTPRQVCFANILQICLTCDRDRLYRRIEKRARLMLERGLVEEVEHLLAMGFSASLPSMQSIGYRHVNRYLAGDWSLDQAREYLIRDTRRYAKRQLTWFRKNPDLVWCEQGEGEGIVDRIGRFLDKEHSKS